VDINPAARPTFEQIQGQLQQLLQRAAKAVQAKAAAARSNAAATTATAVSGQPASTVALPAPRTPGGQQEQAFLQQQQQQQQQQPAAGLMFMPSLNEMAEGEAPCNASPPAAAAAAAAQPTAFDAPAVVSKPAAGPTTPVPSVVGVGFGVPGRALDSSSSPFAWMNGPQLQPPLPTNFMSPFMASSTTRLAAQAGDSS
jgi:hypothetical protein